MKAMILAAGRGERMRPLTDAMPKPLLKVAGKSLIVWHIENLVRAGIHELVINHAYLGELIEKSLGDGQLLRANIQYSSEVKALETAGGIANALPLLGENIFAVVNGDIFCDYDFSLLIQHAIAMQANNDNAHLVLVKNPIQHPSGDFGLQQQRATNKSPKFTFSGIGIYRPSLFANIQRGSTARLAPLLQAQIDLDKVSAEKHKSLWADVGTPQRLAELDKQMRTLHNMP